MSPPGSCTFLACSPIGDQARKKTSLMPTRNQALAGPCRSQHLTAHPELEQAVTRQLLKGPYRVRTAHRMRDLFFHRQAAPDPKDLVLWLVDDLEAEAAVGLLGHTQHHRVQERL